MSGQEFKDLGEIDWGVETTQETSSKWHWKGVHLKPLKFPLVSLMQGERGCEFKSVFKCSGFCFPIFKWICENELSFCQNLLLFWYT